MDEDCIAKWRVLVQEYEQHTAGMLMKLKDVKERERACNPNNADPQSAMKVNPNPQCKHQITILHTFYRSNSSHFSETALTRWIMAFLLCDLYQQQTTLCFLKNAK